MYHPIPHELLIATNRIDVKFIIGEKIINSQGSGFWIVINESEYIFVTNKHVLDLEFRGTQYKDMLPKLYSIEILIIDVENKIKKLNITNAQINKHIDPHIDIAILKSVNSSYPESFVHGGITLTTVADEKFFLQELEWGATLSFSSFQAWIDSVTEWPIVRTGTLASNPRHQYTSDKTELKELLLIEAMSFEGSSGSPVFANACDSSLGKDSEVNTNRPLKLIGIVCEYFQYKNIMHTGLSTCHRSDTLLRMINDDSLSVTVPWCTMLRKGDQ